VKKKKTLTLPSPARGRGFKEAMLYSLSRERERVGVRVLP
jgi:hypothetical protein